MPRNFWDLTQVEKFCDKSGHTGWDKKICFENEKLETDISNFYFSIHEVKSKMCFTYASILF